MTRTGAITGALCLAASFSCVGTIGDDPENPKGPDVAALCAAGDLPGPHPRLVRLTHAQYDNSVSQILGGARSPSTAFIDDPSFAGFDNNAEKLVVSARLARDYRRAAEAIAELLPLDELSTLLPCSLSAADDACLDGFIRNLGRRVYRRPLSEAEVERYEALFSRGTALFASGGSFEQGVRHVVEAMLQSPHFLYRVELSEELDGEHLIPLTGWEVASRLAYLLWNSTPDDALLDAAAAGGLATVEGIEAQARRLLDDARAAGPIQDFHAQWLQIDRYENLTKDDQAFPEFDTIASARSMQEETRRFIHHVILELEGDYETLMTSRTTFVDDRLAAVYGLTGSFGSDFSEVELDATRAGLLTQAGFLASHAYPDDPSPIHRGVFVQRRILCRAIPDPPGNVDTNLPMVSPDQTNRERVEAFTSGEACASCHSLINEPGYSFESYDAIGRWRDTDGGHPVDASGSIGLDGALVPFDGGVALIQALAASNDAKACYLTQWFRYGFARSESAADECTLDVLHERMLEAGYDIKDLLLAFTKTKTFRYRMPEEAWP
jgi:hypothetical protein